ncbi:MAG: hypothetical protein JW751_28520 [Polyangiaceae bacterium]|nr:hypothetical protein [Polyangiaceae bacterium]
MIARSHLLRTIAVAAECDPRSVRRVLTGQPVRALVRMRIERAIHALGLEGEVVSQ